MNKTGFGLACVLGVAGFLAQASATEQVYHPVSPALGGNPNNGPFLLSTAQSQGEGVKSGNQGPTINFPPINTGTNPGTTNGTNGGGGTGTTTNATFRANSLANPLGTSSGRF
jgi:curli production assembly/transport component CsgF